MFMFYGWETQSHGSANVTCRLSCLQQRSHLSMTEMTQVIRITAHVVPKGLINANLTAGTTKNGLPHKGAGWWVRDGPSYPLYPYCGPILTCSGQGPLACWPRTSY